eukprot:1623777-Prymnesium_polylepis.1
MLQARDRSGALTISYCMLRLISTRARRLRATTRSIVEAFRLIEGFVDTTRLYPSTRVPRTSKPVNGPNKISFSCGSVSARGICGNTRPLRHCRSSQGLVFCSMCSTYTVRASANQRLGPPCPARSRRAGRDRFFARRRQTRRRG